jgi:hypothetical protein
MRVFVILLFVINALFFSCRDVNADAAEYNNRVIRLQKKITDDLSLLDSTLRDTRASKERTQYHYARVQAGVKHSILSLDSVGSFNNDPLLLLGARNLFRSYEKIIDEDYRRLIEFKHLPAEAVTLAIQDSSIEVQNEIRKASQMAQDEFILVQKEFALKFHLELK